MYTYTEDRGNNPRKGKGKKMEGNTKLEKVTMFTAFGKRYLIAKDDHGYWGLDENLFDETGRMKSPVNGIQGRLSRTLQECINSCKMDAEVSDMVANGIELMDALRIYCERHPI